MAVEGGRGHRVRTIASAANRASINRSEKEGMRE